MTWYGIVNGLSKSEGVLAPEVTNFNNIFIESKLIAVQESTPMKDASMQANCESEVISISEFVKQRRAHYRAVFHSNVWKVLWCLHWICFTTLSDWLENHFLSRLHLNQSLLARSSFYLILLFASISDWFIFVFSELFCLCLLMSSSFLYIFQVNDYITILLNLGFGDVYH